MRLWRLMIGEAESTAETIEVSQSSRRQLRTDTRYLRITRLLELAKSHCRPLTQLSAKSLNSISIVARSLLHSMQGCGCKYLMSSWIRVLVMRQRLERRPGPPVSQREQLLDSALDSAATCTSFLEMHSFAVVPTTQIPL
jgi:hypothetical protein